MQHHTRESLIAFEARIKALFEAGELPFLLHFSGGNEGQLIDIFRDVRAGDWIFSGHRSQYHYLLAGGDPDRLERFIRNGRSMFVFDHAINFFTSSVLGGTCGIAAGVAYALKEAGSPNRVWCFLGDGAEESGHFYEACSFVHWHQLPCVFVVEDNSRSVTTPLSARRPSGADEWPKWPSCVRRYLYVPAYPHAGRGPGPMVTFKADAVSAAIARTAGI